MTRPCGSNGLVLKAYGLVLQCSTCWALLSHLQMGQACQACCKVPLKNCLNLQMGQQGNAQIH